MSRDNSKTKANLPAHADDTLSCPHTLNQGRCCHHLQHPAKAIHHCSGACSQDVLATLDSTWHGMSDHTACAESWLLVCKMDKDRTTFCQAFENLLDSRTGQAQLAHCFLGLQCIYPATQIHERAPLLCQNQTNQEGAIKQG